jgi:hypothetical protein
MTSLPTQTLALILVNQQVLGQHWVGKAPQLHQQGFKPPQKGSHIYLFIHMKDVWTPSPAVDMHMDSSWLHYHHKHWPRGNWATMGRKGTTIKTANHFRLDTTSSLCTPVVMHMNPSWLDSITATNICSPFWQVGISPGSYVNVGRGKRHNNFMVKAANHFRLGV